MNRPIFFKCLLLSLVCLLAVSTGCRRKPSRLTYIPGHSRSVTNEIAGLMDDDGRLRTQPGDGVGSRNLNPDMLSPNKSFPLPERSKRENMNEDRDFFKASTLYFDFDKSAVRQSEQSKVTAVAEALKSLPAASVEIEGHCDERGTEEYNRSLGERRALSVREYLIRLGISDQRIFTISFGEDKPAVPGHNEAAWAKNRRGEFILLTPKN